MWIQEIGIGMHDARTIFVCKRCGIQFSPRAANRQIYTVSVTCREYRDHRAWNLNAQIQVCAACIAPFETYMQLRQHLTDLQTASKTLTRALTDTESKRSSAILVGLDVLVNDVMIEFTAERDRITPTMIQWYPDFGPKLDAIDQREAERTIREANR